MQRALWCGAAVLFDPMYCFCGGLSVLQFYHAYLLCRLLWRHEPSSQAAVDKSFATGPINANEHFIVWMRTAALSHFRKLWGRIDIDLPKRTTITVAIANRYNIYRFNGEKHVVLSTSSWLGGKNDFLGIAYIVVGGISFLCGCVFFVVQWRFPRQRGDVSYLSWNANAAANTDLH